VGLLLGQVFGFEIYVACHMHVFVFHLLFGQPLQKTLEEDVRKVQPSKRMSEKYKNKNVHMVKEDPWRVCSVTMFILQTKLTFFPFCFFVFDFLFDQAFFYHMYGSLSILRCLFCTPHRS